MKVFKKKELLQNYVLDLKSIGLSIGFVPTMGALHQGHISLVKASQAQNQITIVSIFVNPTQFDNLEDLKKYPYTLEKDLKLLEENNCDVVFTPSTSEMYGNSTSKETFDFGGIENQMEGAFRKGHFDGVGTIVKRLFEVVKPHRSYFGEKDFQQLQIIKKLVDIEQFDIEVIGCPIHREKNGLAMSSRNQRLTTEEKEEAGLIFRSLSYVKENYKEAHLENLKNWVKKEFENNPSLTLEYFTIAEESSLESIEKKEENQKPRAFIAAFLNSVRLIDNLALHDSVL